MANMIEKVKIGWTTHCALATVVNHFEARVAGGTLIGP